jgi:cell division septation protein DedD
VAIAAVAGKPAAGAAAGAPRVADVSRLVARATVFWVQVGAFRSGEKAMRVVSALRDQAASVVTAPDDPLVRVVVGPFTNRDAAASKLRDLRARGYEAFIPAALR